MTPPGNSSASYLDGSTELSRHVDGPVVAPVCVIPALHLAIDRRDNLRLRPRFVEGLPRLEQF